MWNTIGIIFAQLLVVVSIITICNFVRFLQRQWQRSFPRISQFSLNYLCNSPVSEPLTCFDLSIVIPAYNEENRIASMLGDSITYFEDRSRNRSTASFKAEIIVVDDGSKDSTLAVVEKITKKLNPKYTTVGWIRFPKNMGKGAATAEGILASRGKFVLFADADGATNIKEVEKLEAALSKADFACGSRCLQDKACVVQRNFLRHLLMKAFKLFVKIFGVGAVKDTQCGFKLLKRSVAFKIVPNLRLDRWIFDVEMLYLAERFGLKVVEVPINWYERDGSKLSLAVDSITMATDLIMMRAAYACGLWKVGQLHKNLCMCSESNRGQMEEFRSPRHGIGLRTIKDFEKNSLLLDEQVSIGVVSQNCLKTHCSYCFRLPVKHSVKKCANCKIIYYCSEKCQRKDWDIHKSECTLFNLLEEVPFPLMRLHVRALIKMKASPDFTSDLFNSVSSIKYMFAVTLLSEPKLFSLDISHLDPKLVQHFREWGRIVSGLIPFAIPKFSEDEHSVISAILKSNSFSPTNEQDEMFALLYFQKARRLNHSCEPNAEYSCLDRNMRIMALNPLSKGDEVLISYVDRCLPYEDRHLFIEQNFFFDCKCSAACTMKQ